MKRPSRSYEIALSAISCAVATASLTVGCYVNAFLAAGYIFAVFALLVPLSKKLYLGDFLAYLGATLFAFLFGGFSFLRLVPFVAFFGLHPLVSRLLSSRIRRRSLLQAGLHLLKAVWFDLAMWLSWAVLVPVFGVENATWYPFVEKYFFLVLFVGGTLFFFVYDFLISLCQKSTDVIVSRFRKS